MFFDFLEYLGFNREDIIKVANNEMTAREAYRSVAKEEYKDRQWICCHRKFYEFDKNVAIEGNYGSVYVDEFPFPFDEQPILDCSKVKTACIYFENNKRKVKLINVNSNPDSIHYTNIREAIIDEVIDASKVNIYGTKFGEQKVINLDKSIEDYKEEDVLLADTGEEKPEKKKKIRVLSNASSLDTIIEGLENGSFGIGLFRDEYVTLENKEILQDLKGILLNGYFDDEDNSITDKIFKEIYDYADKMHALSKDKDIVFRLTNISPKDLLNNKELEYAYFAYEGASALLHFSEILESEARAIIRVVKKHNKTAKILIPCVYSKIEFEAIKGQILDVAFQEGYDNVEVGAMIENVDAARISDYIAKSADFISIGTNDLTESVLNKKRSIDDKDFSILNDEVKKYINMIVHRVKRTKDVPISICGEHINYTDNIEYFLNLDIDFITVNSNLVRGYSELLNTYYEDGRKKVKKK